MQVSEDTVNRELICEWLLRPVAIDVIDRVWHQPLAQGAAGPGRRGKSEQHRAGCRVTPGGGDPRESATEIRPPHAPGAVRVKRCGKSAPAGG
jgi:hypothetical protein